jgi:hypothetical protein
LLDNNPTDPPFFFLGDALPGDAFLVDVEPDPMTFFPLALVVPKGLSMVIADTGANVAPSLNCTVLDEGDLSSFGIMNALSCNKVG